jgi:hypothetical protein
MVKKGFKLTYYYNGEKQEYKQFETFNEAASVIACMDNFIKSTGGVMGKLEVTETEFSDEDPYIYEMVTKNEQH